MVFNKSISHAPAHRFTTALLSLASPMMPTALLQSLINQLQAWVSRARQQATDPQEVLQDPPDSQLLALRQVSTQLPVPPTYRQSIQDQLTAAVTRWRDRLDAENCLVITASPSEPLSDMLMSALARWPQVDVELLQPLQGYHRPVDPLAIQAQLSNLLPADSAEQETAPAAQPENPLEARRQVVVIPALEQCFLRCIQGWEGIEYLQHRVVQDTSRFWVIGCSSWSWVFLDRVCQISAYLEHVWPLPELTAADLEEWLQPLTQQVDQTRSAPETSAEETHWSALANLAEGNAAIATHLWLHSLGVRSEDIANDPQHTPDKLPLHPRKPILPSLPSLTPLDRYLLHSLLIHKYLTRPQLALSLGETETVARSRVQVLRRTGIILESHGQLHINPIHYPRLRSELSNNNFLIGQT